jgi:hypothetical protein
MASSFISLRTLNSALGGVHRWFAYLKYQLCMQDLAGGALSAAA